jgi:predicted alpha-1,2-mannosidase
MFIPYPFNQNCNMLRNALLFSGSVIISIMSTAQSPVQYVQPLAGTAPSVTAAAIAHSEAGSERNANTIPAVTVPFAMTQWTPQTRFSENKCVPPYFYNDSVFSGFRGSHWLNGSCTQDYGSITLFPVAGHLPAGLQKKGIPFAHANEQASPSLYSIRFPEQQLQARITATARCAMIEFSTGKDDSLYILISNNSDRNEGRLIYDHGKVYANNPAHRIYQGWGEPAGFDGWFFIETDKKAAAHGSFQPENLIVLNDTAAGGNRLGIWLGFFLRKNETLRIRIGSSFTGRDGAQKNLTREINHWDFNKTERNARLQWNQALGKISITKGAEKEKRIFYTALYHALQHPRLFNDVDGKYPAFAQQYQYSFIKEGNYYDDFSFWDIFRAQLPLLEILFPEKVADFARSVVLKGEQGGWLPIFPCWNNYTAAMIGDHAAVFLASAYNKGIRNFPVSSAYALMRKNAFETPSLNDYKNGKGRRALTSYLQYGYVPMNDSVPFAFHKKEQVSRTLEYAFDDYAVASLAKALQHTEDYRILSLRAKNYQHVFDKAAGMMRGRWADGTWFASFHADKRESYITEGTPRQYSFFVPHDVPGLADLMGGKDGLEKNLDSLFLKDQYWHGNEPGHQIPFLYNYTNAPWKTSKTVKKILAEEYTDGPGGLSGNDDAGQMSAWYVFAALGFYPVNPVDTEYALFAPLFEDLTLHLPGNKKWRIQATRQNATDGKPAFRINGKIQQQHFISHRTLTNGGSLMFLPGKE